MLQPVHSEFSQKRGFHEAALNVYCIFPSKYCQLKGIAANQECNCPDIFPKNGFGIQQYQHYHQLTIFQGWFIMVNFNWLASTEFSFFQDLMLGKCKAIFHPNYQIILLFLQF